MLIRMTAFETVIASIGILFAKLSLYTKTGLARTLCELCLRALKLMRLARSKLCVIYFVYVRSLLRKGFYNFSLFEREMFITSDEKSGSSKVFSCNSSIFHSPVSNCFVLLRAVGFEFFFVAPQLNSVSSSDSIIVLLLDKIGCVPAIDYSVS